MANLNPEFVNWDSKPARDVGGGMFERHSKRVTDLHVEFEKGGVTLKNPKDYKSSRPTTTEENAYDIELKEPLESQVYYPPSKLDRDGSVSPAPDDKVKKGHSVTPEFERPGTEPPRIKAWWWTAQNQVCPPKFKGHVDNPPEAG